MSDSPPSQTFRRAAHLDTFKRTMQPVELRVKAAKAVTEIKLDDGFPIPESLKTPVTKDDWDKFWIRTRKHQSFVVTESFSHTVKQSAAKRGIIVGAVTAGPFKVRVFILQK